MDTASPLTVFLDDCIRTKAGPDVPPETVEEMRAELYPRLVKWIILHTLTELQKTAPDSFNEFRDLVGNAATTADDIQKYIETHIPDSVAFLTLVLTEFRSTYLNA